MKGKKGQFFIFTALILIAFSTLMLSSNDVTPTPSKNFKDVYDNYVFESNKAVNNALFEGADVREEYDRFMRQFINYASQKKLTLEIFAIVADQDTYHLVNQMDEPVTIVDFDYTLGRDQDTFFTRNVSELTIRVPDTVFHENIYKLTFPDKETEVKAVLRVSKGQSTEIFVKE